MTLSVIIAVAASYAALDLAGRVAARKRWAFAAWLTGGSVTMGIGIWSMHFTGMLAFHLPVPIAYYWRTVLLSYFVAFLAALLALYLVSRRQMSTARAGMSGILMGSGIASLHYLDMFSMRMSAEMHFDVVLVALSIVLAIAFSFLALRLEFYVRDVQKIAWRKIGGAGVMGAAICAMHYTGMAAATFTASALPPDHSGSVNVSSLGTLGIIIVTLLVLGLAILSSLVDQRFHAQALQLTLAESRTEFAYVAGAANLAELAASIAHEINQPLGSIGNSASASLRWLAAQPPNLDEAREAAAQTVREANRASDVIARVRGLLKKEPPRMQRLDINEAIHKALHLMNREITACRVVVKTDLDVNIPAVMADRVQLEQVMLNLITNALEAMSSIQDRPRELLISSATTADGVHVSMADSGCGLANEHLDRLFRPFFTTKLHGIGMGLSISRSIIEAHGGRLWAARGDRYGAVFQLILPKANGTE